MPDSETLNLLRSIDGRLGLLGHQIAILGERITKLEASNTRAIAALNDVVRKRVTPGEVEALHSEMKQFRDAEFNHEVRLRQLEDELDLAPST